MGKKKTDVRTPDPIADVPLPATGEEIAPLPTKPPRNRLQRILPDTLKVTCALVVIGLAIAVWIKPPLIRGDFPALTYTFAGQTSTDAMLYRPLAMPTRYYIRLPKKLADRYEWFAVDRRREVAALTDAPIHSFCGLPAIKRSAPLGLDLEFRKLDNSEWRVFFLPESIVFSNALLCVRLDAKR